MNSNEVILEVGRMHLQIIQLQGMLDKQAAELAELKAPKASAPAEPAPQA